MAADTAAWPQCPSCKSKDIIFAEGLVRCLSCSRTGSSDDLRKHKAFRYMAARTSISAREPGNVIQFGPFPQNADSEFGDILKEGIAQLTQQTLFNRYLFQARRHLEEKGCFPPTLIAYAELGHTPQAWTLKTKDLPVEESLTFIRGIASASEAVAILFEADSEGRDYADPEGVAEYARNFSQTNIEHPGVKAQAQLRRALGQEGQGVFRDCLLLRH